MVAALIALTSYNEKFHPNGKKTGVYFVEALHPWRVFTENNIDVTFVSETGTFGWDENSITKEALGDDYEFFEKHGSKFFDDLKNIKKASDVESHEYQIFFAAGGHGTVFDFPKAKDLHRLAYEIYSHENVLAAVCHGPAIFDNLNDAFGQRLIQGKKVTGFTDEGETAMHLDETLREQNLPTVKQIADISGAQWVQPSEPWAAFTVVDGNLVTGVNPASATETAQKAIDALKGTWAKTNP